MSSQNIPPINIAIVDYGLGNLFSVKQACEHVGMQATVTASRTTLLQADAVLLPGVGAYGNAMTTLHKLDLVSVLQDIAASGTPLIGICLGMQLLMTESHEFGYCRGLGIIEGSVAYFGSPVEGSCPLKIPHVGWSRLVATRSWANTLLDHVEDGAYMYFVHSYILHPSDPGVILAKSRYGQIEFCSSIWSKNVFACQFHPERSGLSGLQMYRNLPAFIQHTARMS